MHLIGHTHILFVFFDTFPLEMLANKLILKVSSRTHGARCLFNRYDQIGYIYSN